MSVISYEEQSFLKILKTAIKDTPLKGELMDSGEYTTEQWTKIISIANYHNVFPLVFEKLSEDSSFIQLVRYPTYLIQAISMIGSQVRKTEAFLVLYKAFTEENIHPIVVKGIICRQLYGKYQDHRPSGDEDLLIELREYNKICTILKQQGYITTCEVANEKQLKELHEISFCNMDFGLSIDVHVNPFDSKNGMRKKLNCYFHDIFVQYRDVDINGVSVRTMNHTEHLLYLIFHVFKHFTAGGVGIRQVIDILLYMEQYGDYCDWNYLDTALAELKAEVFLADLVQIGNQYLGFDLSIHFPTNCPDNLLEDILNCGTFGNSTEELVNAGQITSAAMSGKSTMLSVIFPGKERLISRHPILSEKPWLLPVFWVQRWKRGILRSKRSGINATSEGMKIGQKRVELLKKYKII